jgi:hypothetical protein
MAKTQKAVHVAVVKSKYKDRTYETVLLRHTYREDGKVRVSTCFGPGVIPRFGPTLRAFG